ncbi:bacillithiol system redox-active protein YtxJ [Paenibacillus sp. ACRSA]|uniref:bacillithiol system redox-active protein YtxJ n=1 Tax=Paenibacillus sp. ACRSA TaxID=2918211 RepID=UPI001EF74942|nr:bacillithiol system redox-active protein YtxJ [Paenibacillus sp. ACRSA]MCG7379883.1 bacillithiol system redox-active protein YtxJ [Paenibacillus sp. ACRSA]
MNLKVNHQLLWTLVGIAIGTSIGIATNQTALGVAFGITLGILIGSVVSKRIRSDSDETLREHVSELIKPSDWQEALQNSEDHPVLILKHSTTCPTSARAYREFMAFVGSNASESKRRMDYHIVKVIESRALSRHIAEETAVIHQSPQVLLLEQGRVIQHTSHGKITKKRLTQWAQDPFN